MIDTIEIAIINIHKYPFLVEMLNESAKGQGKTITHFNLNLTDEQDFIMCRDIGQKNPKMTQHEDHNSSKSNQIYSNHIHQPSSHYDLAYQINVAKNCILFNFSIPKFLFGTNICQFVKHPNETYGVFARSEQENFETVMSRTYDRLMHFVNTFVKTFTNVITSVGGNKVKTLQVEPIDVEIRRLDMCFNQYFKSKKDAFEYLMTQKRIKKKYIRESSNNKTDWRSSIFLKTDYYVAKIYHKGDEYRSKKGDLSDHKRINKKYAEKGLNAPFDIPFLQAEADRILRYEISFKRAYMSRLFKQNIFRVNCPEHQKMKEIEKEHKRLKDKNKRAWEKYYKIEDETGLSRKNISYNTTNANECAVLGAYAEVKKTADKLKKYNAQTTTIQSALIDGLDELEHGTIEEHNFNYAQISKIYNNMLAQTNEFCLNVWDYYKEYSAYTIDLNIKKDDKVFLWKPIHFSPELFGEMAKVFKDFIEQFTLSEKVTSIELRKKMVAYNNEFRFSRTAKSMNRIRDIDKKMKGKPLSKQMMNSLVRIVALLDSYSIDEMVKLKIISKASKYRILENFRKLGFDHRALTTVNILTQISFTDYYDTIINNMAKFRLKNGYFR